MSFNPNDNNLHPISRTNYEEHFLLYADNELSTVEKTAVEEFVKAHPDLQQELDLLMLTKLPLETMSLEGKEGLLAESMKLNSVDEKLLLYIDNELNKQERKAVEKKLKDDKSFQLQYADLLKTKPATPDKIVYPYKKELFRYEVKKPFPVYWMRIAAAVVIISGISMFVLNNEQKTDIVIAEGAKKIQPAEKIDDTIETKTTVAIKTENAKPEKPSVAKTVETKDAPQLVKNPARKQEQSIKKQPVIPPLEKEQEIIAKKEPQVQEENNIVVNKKTELPSQTLNNTTVTPPSIASLDNQATTSAVTAVQNDVAKIDNEKKSSLKGILRKATRFIERRTNISATNEDNELLIGAVALKL
jgi:hypothetical protein